jgi:site-specific recombinase XerC
MYVSDIKQFAAASPGITVETLTQAQAQEWATKLLKEGISAKTLRRKLSALRNYWSFLVGNQVADAANQPFKGLWLKGDRRATQQFQRGDKAFEAEEIVHLWRVAVAERKTSLADLIRLAAFTVCSTKSFSTPAPNSVRF